VGFLSLSLSLSYSLTCIGVHCSLVCDSFSRGYYSAYSMLHFFLTGRSSFSIQWRKKRGRVCELEPGMVGGPARDLALSRPFWQGKEWAMLRSRDSAPLPPHLLHIIIHLSFSPHLLASCNRLSPPTFLGVCFLRGTAQKGSASKAGLGPSSLWPWSAWACDLCRLPCGRGLRGGARILCRV
jgi:hypothetical protein